MVVIELRCIRHKHGEVDDDIQAVYCRRCSKARGEVVLHRWDVRTWERIDTDDHDDVIEQDQPEAA